MSSIWERLARQRICFGHQSVGAGLMTALSTLNGGHITIVEGRHPDLFQQPVFGHFRVGTNRDPLSKCRDFSAVIDAGVGERVDVAFFKLCYVDITSKTDIHGLYEAYCAEMDALARAYPAVAFLHITVPLKRINGGLLSWMREQCGVCDEEREGQAKRHAYNDLLRSRYGASGRLFDLAAEEAACSNGVPDSIWYRGRTIPNLISDYTDDGGHLNKSAAERIGGRLLDCVSSAREVIGVRSERGAVS